MEPPEQEMEKLQRIPEQEVRYPPLFDRGMGPTGEWKSDLVQGLLATLD